MIPDRHVSVLSGQHRPPSEWLHHGRGLLVQGEPDLAGHEGGLVGDVEHGVVHLQRDGQQTRGYVPELLVPLPVEELHQPAVPSLHHLLELGAHLEERIDPDLGHQGLAVPVLLWPGAGQYHSTRSGLVCQGRSLRGSGRREGRYHRSMW